MPIKLDEINLKDINEQSLNHDLIKEINSLVAEDNISRQNKGDINLERLNAILNLCEKCITSIPIEDRTILGDDTQDPKFKSLTEQYPYLISMIELQKKTVLLLNIGRHGKREPQARWNILKGLFLSDAPQIKKPFALKSLEPEYFDEFQYGGAKDVAMWLKSGSPFHHGVLASFGESSDISKQIIYLDNLTIYHTYIANGLVYNTDDKLFDTQNSIGLNIETGKSIFCLSADLELYLSNPDVVLDPTFHHSSFFKGRPVACAGTMEIKNGCIVEITLLSGHYKPNRKHMLTLLKSLQEKGVDLSQVRVKDHPDGSEQNAQYYLDHKGFLPGEMFYKAASFAKTNMDANNYQRCIDNAVSLNHQQAKYSKGIALISGWLYNQDIMQGISILLSLAKNADMIGNKARTYLTTSYPDIMQIHHIYDSNQSSTDKLSAIQAMVSKFKNYATLAYCAELFLTGKESSLVELVQKQVMSIITKGIAKNKKFTITDEKNIEKVFSHGEGNLLEQFRKIKEQNEDKFESMVKEVKSSVKNTSRRLPARKKL